MKRTQSDGVYVWFFGRNDPSVPPEIRTGRQQINPGHGWGVPEARFPSDENCNFASHFADHTITFDTTFCVSYVSCTSGLWLISWLDERRATGLATLSLKPAVEELVKNVSPGRITESACS